MELSWLKGIVKMSDERQRRAAKNLLRFLAAVLLLTLVARGTAGATLPRVQTTHPAPGEIVQRVRGSATVRPVGSRALQLPEGLVLTGVLASAGQSVAPGDALAQFDVELLAELLQREQTALAEMELDWRLLQRGETHDGSALESARRAQTRARQDYDITRQQTDAELAALREALAQAQAAAQAAWNTLQATPPEISAPPSSTAAPPPASSSEVPPPAPSSEAAPPAPAADPAPPVAVPPADPAPAEAPAVPVGELLRAALFGNSTPAAGLAAPAPIAALAAPALVAPGPIRAANPAYQAAYDDWAAKDVAAAAARSALAEGENRAQASMLAATRAVEDADAAFAAAQQADTEARRQRQDNAAKNNLGADALQLDIADKREKIAQLQALAGQNGQLTAPWEGTVEQLPAPGDTTGVGAGFRLTDSSGGFEAEMWVGKGDAERLKPGDICEVATAGGSMYYREILQGAITAVGTPGEDGRARVTLRLPGVDWKSGQALDVLAVQETQSHALCVPLSALHASSEGYYVLVLEEQTTVLGLETVAVAVPVSILAQDEQNAAVEGMLGGQEDIVSQSSKAVQPGDRVRMAA